MSPPAGFMGCVAVESPYAQRAPFTVDDHVRYARLCMADALNRGEAPFLSHLLYTQCLQDTVPDQRAKGMAAGLALSQKLDFAAAYIDLGVSSGMAAAFAHYREIGFRCELRRLFTPQIGEALRAGRMTLKKAGELQ